MITLAVLVLYILVIYFIFKDKLIKNYDTLDGYSKNSNKIFRRVYSDKQLENQSRDINFYPEDYDPWERIQQQETQNFGNSSQ